MPTLPPASRSFFVRSYTNRDFEAIREELSALVQATRPDLWSDIFESNLGATIMEMIALVGDIVTMGQDVAALETFLSTCRRYESALRFAKSVGFHVQTAIPAEVVVDSLSIPQGVTDEGALIAKGTTITANGLEYELLEDVVIAAGDTTAQLTLFEGKSYEEVFNAAATPNFEATTERGVVAEGSWVVYVGSVNDPNNIWREVDSLAFEARDAKVYEVRFDTEGRLTLVFGDDVTGAVPNGDITVRYRTTAGAAGNAAVNSIEGSVSAAILTSTGTVNITFRNTTTPAAGGADRPDVAALKRAIPAYLRSSDRIITIQDYDNFARQVSGVAQAISTPLRATWAANVVEVNVWGEEDVTFTSESPVNGRRSSVDYTRFAQLASSRINDIHAVFTPRTLLTVSTVIQPREVAWVDLYLGTIRYDSRFDADTVHEDITRAVVSVFQASGGFKLALSDLYEAVRALPAVTRLLVDRVVFERKTPLAATGSIRMTDVPAEGESITISDGSTSVKFEVDTDATLVDPLAFPVNPGTPNSLTTFTTALKSAIENNLGITVRRELDEDGVVTLVLTNMVLGVVGNVAITTSTNWNLTVTGMQGGSDDPVASRTDYRRDMNPDPDPYPTGAYVEGEPFVSGGPAWQDGGIPAYEELQDLVFANIRASRNFYNDQYLYNNEIFYDSVQGLVVPPQVMNLRRLVFELSPETI